MSWCEFWGSGHALIFRLSISWLKLPFLGEYNKKKKCYIYNKMIWSSHLFIKPMHVGNKWRVNQHIYSQAGPEVVWRADVRKKLLTSMRSIHSCWKHERELSKWLTVRRNRFSSFGTSLINHANTKSKHGSIRLYIRRTNSHSGGTRQLKHLGESLDLLWMLNSFSDWIYQHSRLNIQSFRY